jgi:cysteinyl-tRNA synthetase
VLGFISLRQAEDTAPPVSVKEIEQLIADRKSLRKQRDFAAADQIRTDLDARGILLEDDSTGTRWKRK